MGMPTLSFTDRVRPIIEVGIGSAQVPTGAALWDVALWDDSQSRWAGDEPVWRDITCDVQAVDAELGRARVTEAFPTGTCDVIVDNRSGWADPAVEEAGVLSMRPGRPLRVGVDHAAFGPCWLFRGWIDRIEPTYDPVEPDWVRLSSIDALGEAGRAKLSATVPSGADETASARVTRILDLVPWLTTKRDIEATSIELVAAVLDGQALDMLRRCADSAGGACFGDIDGNVVFRGRDWLFYTADDPIDGTIGNVDAADVCPSQWVRPFARSDIATRVILNRVLPDGTEPSEPRVFEDTPGQVLYGVEPLEVADLWTRDDADMDIIGMRLLAERSAVSMPLVDAVALDAATGDDVIDLLSTMSIWKPSRYRCRLVEDRGLVFDRTYFACGVSFHMDPDQWTAEVRLDWSELYEIPTTAARWDAALWDRAVWLEPVT